MGGGRDADRPAGRLPFVEPLLCFAGVLYGARHESRYQRKCEAKR